MGAHGLAPPPFTKAEFHAAALADAARVPARAPAAAAMHLLPPSLAAAAGAGTDTEDEAAPSVVATAAPAGGSDADPAVVVALRPRATTVGPRPVSLSAALAAVGGRWGGKRVCCAWSPGGR